MNYITVGNLQVDKEFFDFIDTEATAGLEITTQDFFKSLEEITNQTSQHNQDLLNKRDDFQAQIDNWHNTNDYAQNFDAYKQFLIDIGYLLPEVEDFNITTTGVDAEIAEVAGPQLVVPVTSARFALNALNARFGSLYNSLYGTDVISQEDGCEIGKEYNTKRAAKVIAWANNFLDNSVPLLNAQYDDISTIEVVDNLPVFHLKDGTTTTLNDSTQYLGYNDTGVLLTNNNLRIELSLKDNTLVDVILESAVSTIIDFEDSAATVAGSEKVLAYRNFLGLVTRTLKAQFNKGGKVQTRTINPDKEWSSANGTTTTPATSLMLVRNVGLHMFSDIVLDANGNNIAEGVLDALTTSLISMHDRKLARPNAKDGSIYIVKPKMHGPEEVKFSTQLFALVEQALGLAENTIKIGIMDEERRTSVNLKNCIYQAKERVIFINTGFLDRTGDEIHTSMHAGAVVNKNNIKHSEWIKAYEKLNVETGLKCGFYKRAQIGKGMWAIPDNMADMLEQKVAHLKMGGNCAWVPSPTAATLHATHYHNHNVFEIQQELQQAPQTNTDDLLKIPLLTTELDAQNIADELNNNAQSILGYVVRWVGQGVGCSKVEDINNVGLMEDRATLRISSQHIANWLLHNICTKEQVETAFKEMAKVVDMQNSNDPNYQNLSPSYDSFSFQASLALVFEGVEQANGYTEDALTKYRALELNNAQ